MSGLIRVGTVITGRGRVPSLAQLDTVVTSITTAESDSQKSPETFSLWYLCWWCRHEERMRRRIRQRCVFSGICVSELLSSGRTKGWGQSRIQSRLGPIGQSCFFDSNVSLLVGSKVGEDEREKSDRPDYQEEMEGLLWFHLLHIKSAEDLNETLQNTLNVGKVCD